MDQKKVVQLQSVGIEPTLLRTRALSVRLNRSAKTAIPCAAMAISNVGCCSMLSSSYDFMAQWQRVGFQTRRLGVRFPLRSSPFLVPLPSPCLPWVWDTPKTRPWDSNPGPPVGAGDDGLGAHLVGLEDSPPSTKVDGEGSASVWAVLAPQLAKDFPRRDLNPGLVGENHIS